MINKVLYYLAANHTLKDLNINADFEDLLFLLIRLGVVPYTDTFIPLLVDILLLGYRWTRETI